LSERFSGSWSKLFIELIDSLNNRSTRCLRFLADFTGWSLG